MFTTDRTSVTRHLAIAVTAVLLLILGSCGTSDAADPSTAAPVPTVTRGEIDDAILTEAGDPSGLAGRWTPLGEPGVGGRVTDVFLDPEDPTHLLAGGDLLGVAVSFDSGETWTPAEGFASHEIGQISADPTRPDVYWVGTMSGPYRSADGGLTWEARREGMGRLTEFGYSAPIEIVLLDPNDADRLVAFGGSHREWDSPGEPAWGAVWQSTDAGDTWTLLANIAGGVNVVDATYLADGTTLVASALDTGLFRSTDGGTSWERLDTGLSNLDVRGLAAHPTDPAILWLALGNGTDPERSVAGGVARSDDGGVTWTAATGLNEQVDSFELITATYLTVEVAPSAPDIVYTADVSWGVNSLFRSEDGGRTFSRVLDESNRPPMAYGSTATAESMDVNVDDPDDVIMGSAESILRTADGGTTWIDLSSTPTTDGGYVGRGWSGLVATDIVFNHARPGEVMLAGFDGANLILSDNDLRSWQRPLIGYDFWGGGYATTVAGPEGQRIYAVLGQAGNFNGIAASEDAGATWRVAFGAVAGLPERYGAAGDHPAIHAFPDDPDRVLAAISGVLHRSVDGGHNWETIETDLAITDVGGHPDDPNRVFLATATGVFESLDGGDSFTDLGGPTGATRIAYDASSESLYATAWRSPEGGLHRLRDGEWALLYDDGYAFDVAVDPADSEHLLLVGNDHPFHDEILSFGVLRSIDGGATWTPLNDGLTMKRVAAVAFDPYTPGRALIGTFGQGFSLIEGLDRVERQGTDG